MLTTVSDEFCNQMDNKFGRTAMARMLDLRDVLELVTDGLTDSPFTRASVCPKGA